MKAIRLIIWILLFAAICHPDASAQTTPATATNDVETARPPSKFRSAEDGWLDVSDFLDEAYGFLPVVVPITEPAVGYGGAGGLAFISKPSSEERAGYGRPNITAVGGMGTENGSWGGWLAISAIGSTTTCRPSPAWSIPP